MMTLLTVLLASTAAHADAPIIKKAKAAELSLHRVERLVTLHKVEANYQALFKGLAVVPVAHHDTSDPAFNVTLSQVAGADGTARTVLIPLTQDGHPLKEVPATGAAPVGAPAWPDADPVTLSENALHYVLDNNTTVPELVPYFEGLTGLTISPGTDPGGAQVAVVDMKAEGAPKTLRILIKTNGQFESYQLVGGTNASALPLTADGLEPTFRSIKDNIFIDRCMDCHRPNGEAHAVPLDTLNDLLNSPRELVLPGNPDESGLVIAVSRTDKKRMPPAKSGEDPLTPDEIAVIKQWIKAGAKD